MLSAIFNGQKARSPETWLFRVAKCPSSPRIGRICVAAAWFGGIGRGGTRMTTGSGGGGGGGGGGLGAQAATLARRPPTMIVRDNFLPVSPAEQAVGVHPKRARRVRLISIGLRLTRARLRHTRRTP